MPSRRQAGAVNRGSCAGLPLAVGYQTVVYSKGCRVKSQCMGDGVPSHAKMVGEATSTWFQRVCFGVEAGASAGTLGNSISDGECCRS
jgi:hypothetical protein